MGVLTNIDVRSAIFPLTKRYRTDILSQKLIMFIIKFYTDNIFSDDTSVRGNKCAQISVCWSGLHGPIAYSLLGGGVPIPEQRLCGTLDSVPLRFKVTTCCTRLSSPPYGVQRVS